MLKQDKTILKQLIENRRLVSVMNHTKWCELVTAMGQRKHLQPLIRIKYLYDEAPPKGFAPIW